VTSRRDGAGPTGLQLPNATVHSLAIEPAVVQGMKSLIEAGHRVTGAGHGGPDAKDLPRLRPRQPHRFAELFRHLLDTDAPMVFHCTAGKDRTGFAAALILQRWA